jgi:hypothetical protein
MSTTKTGREPGSVMRIEDVTLRTDCGHSFATCLPGRCFRLPPELAAERDRMLAAAAHEHAKKLARAASEYDSERRQIEATYRRLAIELNA